MPGGTHKECNVHGTKCVVDWCYEKRISRKKKSSGGEGRVLSQGYLVRGTIQFHKGGARNHPLGHWSPKVNRKRPCIGSRNRRNNAEIGIREVRAHGGSSHNASCQCSTTNGSLLRHCIDLLFLAIFNFVLQCPSKLIRLRQDIGHMTRTEQQVLGFHNIGPSSKQGAVDNQNGRHGQGNDFRSLHGTIVDGRSGHSPTGNGA
mmetsp:Transcript_2255/g.4565  ORF Transcript_2255/g.4565 Transcript_2255/m.4565 type:complete len:203 (+) Transcript_2255:255-863(+)